MSIRCLIIDDEPLARQIIREFLEKHTDILIIADCGNPQEAFEKIQEDLPDLLFLDIQMPEISGFDLLELLPEKPEDYVGIHTGEDKFLVLQRLGEMEARLPPGRFIRVHRSSIVNIDKVRELHPWSSGRYLLIMKDGTEVETSKTGAKLIREMML